MFNRSWITIGLALVVAGALGWWVSKEVQRRELQRQVVAMTQDSTDRLREALGLLAARAEARPTLETHFAALEDAVSELQKLNRSIDPELVRAANAYVTDVHALLRRELALHAGREAVRSDIGAIRGHLRVAGTRSTEWISRALALQQRLNSSYLDYRLAAGGLDKSFAFLRDTSQNLRHFVPASALIEEAQLSSAEKRLAELMAQVEPEVENAKKLPLG
jgi:hypothetical protein